MSFTPDPSFVVEVVPSPNHGERRGGARPDMLILHYTGMPDPAEALTRLCTEGTDVSAHYLVVEDGRIVQMVQEERRAWHAGTACWEGITDVNSRSIGIEIVNPGHDHGYRDFPPTQIAAVLALASDIVARHGIRPERVLAHSDVAPTRKQDPGEKFPWRILAEGGVGRWVVPAPIGAGTESALMPGARGDRVLALQTALASYGYGIECHGRYDALTQAVVRAFQRHFRPGRVDGCADASTLETLRSLLATLDR